MAVQDCDCLLALGMRFDDRVISTAESFAPNAEIIHVDVDPAEIGKNVEINIPIVGDLRSVLVDLNAQLEKQSDLVVCQSLYPPIPLPMSDGINVPWTMQLVETLVDKEKPSLLPMWVNIKYGQLTAIILPHRVNLSAPAV